MVDEIIIKVLASVACSLISIFVTQLIVKAKKEANKLKLNTIEMKAVRPMPSYRNLINGIANVQDKAGAAEALAKEAKEKMTLEFGPVAEGYIATWDLS